MLRASWARVLGIASLAWFGGGAAAAQAADGQGLDQNALRNQALSALDRNDPEMCARLAGEGAQKEGPQREELFEIQGTCLDNAGDGKGAVAAYSEGLRRFPTSAKLHYNLAVTHLGQKALPDALVHAKSAVQSEPTSPRYHGFLGEIYGQLGQKTPALLARLRALSLETDGPVAGAVLIKLLDHLTDGVSRDPGERKVTLQLGPPSEEGDFRTYQFEEGAIKHQELERVAHGGKDDFSGLRKQVVAILEALAKEKPDAGYARLYYLPFFVELSAKGHVETFSYAVFTMGASKDKGLATWLKKHPQQIKQFLSWARGYKHPAPAPPAVK